MVVVGGVERAQDVAFGQGGGNGGGDEGGGEEPGGGWGEGFGGDGRLGHGFVGSEVGLWNYGGRIE